MLFSLLLQIEDIILAYFLKNESRIIKSPVCLSVPPLITFEQHGRCL
jgi:hypothetical protein